MADWRGRGGGRLPGQPSVPGEGGAGAGGGRGGSQPTISSPASWVGSGKGRAGGQPTIAAAVAVSVGARSWSIKASASFQTRTNSAPIGDPEGNYIFALEVDGQEIAHFMECSGLKTSTETFEIQEGGMNHAVHKLPGQSKWENIQLRYGVSGDTTLLAWRDMILMDAFDRSSRLNGSIVVKNNQMQVVRRYHFVDAWPIAWEGPSFSSAASELAIEMIELAHHGIYVS